MAENPYKTPTDDRPIEFEGRTSVGRFTRTWKRYLSNIEALSVRTARIEDIVVGIDPGPPLARILAQGHIVQTSSAGNVWVVLPLNSVIQDAPPENIELLNGAIYYRNSVSNNLYLQVSGYLGNLTPTVVEFGFRRNGDDETVVPQKVSQARTEFASSYFGVCDVVDGDYIEHVVRFGAAQSAYTYNTTVYAQHTGFAPNGV